MRGSWHWAGRHSARRMKDELTGKSGMTALALLVAVSLGLAACGDGDGEEQAATTPEKLAVTASEAGKQTPFSRSRTPCRLGS